MDIKKKTILLKTAMFLAGAFCVFIFLAARIKGLGEAILDPHEYHTGRDLYKEHYIGHFRESHPAFDFVTNKLSGYQISTNNPSINDADILTFGDSYFNFQMLPSFPELLGNRLNRKVYLRRYHNPFSILQDQKYTADKPRLLIYEIGERGIYRKFTRSPFYDTKERNKPTEHWFNILKTGEAEQRYTVFLQQSRWTHKAYKWIATFKFDRFGYISPMTPVYSLNPPFLFFHSTVDDSVSSFFYQHTQDEIDVICDNIQRMSGALRENHQLEMVFLPIPSKISIYSEMVFDDPYNEFLPRIYDGLKSRGVHVIDLYHPYKASTNILYFPSDTHWNEKGIDLALDVTLDYLEKTKLIKLAE